MPDPLLNEDDVRALLVSAAETVDVGPAALPDAEPRRAWLVPLVAAAAVVVLLVGTLWAVRGSSGSAPSPSAPSDLPSITIATGRPDASSAGVVPSVVGLDRAAALRRLTAAGFRVQVVKQDSACVPVTTAIGTTPSAGSHMRPGSTVLLEVGGGRRTLLPTPRTCLPSTPGDVVAQRFLAFARGGPRSSLPVGASVRLYLDHRFSHLLSASQARRPASYLSCPFVSGISNGCRPQSAVDALAQWRGRIVSGELSEDACVSRFGDRPADTGGAQVGVLSPAGLTPCFEAFAVEVWSDDQGRIVAVDLMGAGGT